MSITVHDLGDRRKLSCQIRDEAGALADPTDLEFSIREPDDTVTSYLYGIDIELVRASTGIYYVLWDVAQVGHHWWRYEASGEIQQVEETWFAGRDSQVIESS